MSTEKTCPTPGPWFVALHEEGFGISHSTAKGDYWIADMIPNQPDGASEECNAQLIAAAPDMLKALHDIIKLPGMSQGAMIICTAAILQATGEMP